MLVQFVCNHYRNELGNPGKKQVGMKRFLILGFTSGNTKIVFEMVDGFLNIPSDFVGGIPFIRTETNTDNTSGGAAADGKTLVVYYSATGNTEAVADYIADITGGDLFELEPAEPYTDDDLDYNDRNSRVSQEYADESLRAVELVSDTVKGFDEYEDIFIGYPIWWGEAAWPVDQFIENNDFTGKTVIPFCTSASSGIGDSGQMLEEMAGTGEWLEGERFPSGVSEEDVRAWVENLQL